MSASNPALPAPRVPAPAEEAVVLPPLPDVPAGSGWRGYARAYLKWLIPVVLGIAGAIGYNTAMPAPTIHVEAPATPPAAVPPPAAPLVNARPIDYEGASFHGAEDHRPHLEEAAAKWPVKVLSYSIDYGSARSLNPPLSDEAIRGAIRLAWNWWAEHLALDFVELPHGAAGVHIPIHFEPIDGPGNVLARAYLADGTARPKSMTLDSGERWTAGPPAPNVVSLATVVCHEGGHSLGLGHDSPTAPAVMRPTYTRDLPREQPRDIDRMVNELGYERRASAPPPQADTFKVEATIRREDLLKTLDAAGLKVVPK